MGWGTLYSLQDILTTCSPRSASGPRRNGLSCEFIPGGLMKKVSVDDESASHCSSAADRRPL